MKSLLVVLALLLFSGTAVAAGADSWAGPHVGVRVGWNHSELNNFSSEGAPTAGIEVGWNIVLYDRVVFDPQLFYEWNQDKDRRACHPDSSCTSANVGSRVYGLGLIIGFPVGTNDDLMPYVRLDSSRLHVSGDGGGSGWVSWGIGAGLEWRLTRLLSVNAQYTYAKYGGDVDDWKNSNFTVGINFHF